MEEFFARFANIAGLLIEGVAIFVVAFGSIEAVIRLIPVLFGPGATTGRRKAIFRQFGIWLVLGLEFELAADIIASVVAPTWAEVGKLGAIAVIRTFLNHFLEKDLETVAADVERHAEVGVRVAG